MDTYKIEKSFIRSNDDEIDITSENLIYSEIENFSGCQCRNNDNYDRIHELCKKIADMIREIEELNQ